MVLCAAGYNEMLISTATRRFWYSVFFIGEKFPDSIQLDCSIAYSVRLLR